jgi:hypothetical protein
MNPANPVHVQFVKLSPGLALSKGLLAKAYPFFELDKEGQM